MTCIPLFGLFTGLIAVVISASCPGLTEEPLICCHGWMGLSSVVAVTLAEATEAAKCRLDSSVSTTTCEMRTARSRRLHDLGCIASFLPEVRRTRSAHSAHRPARARGFGGTPPQEDR